MKAKVTLALALVSLLACLVAPLLLFNGVIDAPTYKRVLVAATAGWFVFAIVWKVGGDGSDRTR